MDNEFAAKKGDWYQRNLMLNYSGLMDDEEFRVQVWNCNHEQLRTDFGSDINTLQWSLKNFFEKYEAFLKVSAKLDYLIEHEGNRVPDGWKAYRVLYNEKGCSAEQEFFCYAPSTEKATRLCYKVNGSDVLLINSVEEYKP